ncbi:hypothetical protein QUA71_26155 [Microcoleus sp. MON1_C5]|uniref:hypothetical protein n=1 Tax=Microcoleus sp. MON1_C5 TaxID=2818828 RepID=UPI002FCF1445
MPPNLRKSEPNLSKPSEGGSFNAGKKSTESTNPLQGLNATAERELGSAGGIKATGKLTVGVDNLITQQGLTIEADANNKTLGVGINVGSPKGKLGVSIGGKVGYDERGKISIRGAEAAINIGGFGGSASIDDEKGIGGSISIAGAKVEVTVSPDGKKTLSICYGVPGGEICTIFEPDGKKLGTIPVITPGGVNRNPNNFPTTWKCSNSDISYTLELDGKPFNEAIETIAYNYELYSKQGGEGANAPYDPFDDARANSYYGVNNWVKKTYHYTAQTWYYRDSTWRNRDGSRHLQYVCLLKFEYDYEIYSHPDPFYVNNQIGSGGAMYGYKINLVDLLYPTCPGSSSPSLPEIPSTSNPPLIPINLPNTPPIVKPMKDCCEKVEEIYKYLGIAKLKKNKFPVSNAFLVPGGKGNDNCVDYYAIAQALFRMLANGLIINPKSKPLGTEWQNVNATAWASSMYEMMAESMSDGNSSQRFEIAAIMQLVQLMSAVAENSRKTEMIIDGLGYEPELVPEDLPVCFTIHESHKGFGKKEKDKIKISGLKNDDQVEAALGKMLNPSLVPITSWKFKPGEISIKEALGG